MKSVTQWSAVVLLLVLALGCGGSSPTSPSSSSSGSPQGSSSGSSGSGGGTVTTTCRTYGTTMTDTSTVTPPDNAIHVPLVSACTFDRAQLAYTCQLSQQPAPSLCPVTGTLVGHYGSAGDFVDEVSGRWLYTRADVTLRLGAPCNVTIQTSQVPRYDASRRVTALDVAGDASAGSASGMLMGYPGVRVLTFSAWDAKGRPTQGSGSSDECSSVSMRLSYDDVQRTMTVAVTDCKGGSTVTERFNTDGEFVGMTSVAGGSTEVLTRTISSTAQVCR